MAIMQTRDVLNQARKFHRKLAEFYDDLQDSATKERTRALLSYMSRHENYLDQCLAEFGNEVSDNVLDTYFRNGSDATRLSEISEFSIKEDMDAEDVIAAAMHFDTCLINFYKEMADRTVAQKVRDVFENLLAMERNEQVELSKKSLELDT